MWVWKRRGGEVTQRVGEMKWQDYLRGECDAIGTFSVTHHVRRGCT